jgi:mono/diheme cytochrome c family protein
MNYRLKLLRLGALGMILISGCAPTTADAGGDNSVADTSTIAAGKYLAAAGDCAACHTTPGGAPFAGGVVINTPFGKLLGSNITPDQATGIGGWSDKQFVAALKYGVGHNGARLYPGMPYIYFNKVPAAELIKIHAYLETIPPVRNHVVSNQLPFPFDIRLSMRGWNLLFFPDTGDYQNDASQSAQWNRGAYLVQGLGHCAACHTSKNFLGGDHTGQELQGAVIENANAPDLVEDPHNGLTAWSASDIATYLKTGHNRFAGAAGPMAEVVAISTSQLTMADDTAIGVYLKSLPPSGVSAPAPVAANDPAMLAGGHIYADECAACHNDAGTGEALLFPALKASPVVQAPNPVTMLGLIIHGGQTVGTPAAGAAAMPAFGAELDDQQIADVATYIRNSWGNAGSVIDVDNIPARK